MTLKSLPKPYEIATEKRKLIGEDTDRALLEVIKENPRLSLYELALEIDWKVGKVDGSVKRLLEEGLVKVECFIKNGRRVKLVSKADYKCSPDTFNVPKDLLDTDAPWKDTAYVYGLDRLTIGVSGKPVDEWEETAGLKSKLPLKEADDSLTFQLPKDFAQFYALERSIVTMSAVKDVVLLSIEGQAC
jgi:DNA-binding Lrp family transcriptional regulator